MEEIKLTDADVLYEDNHLIGIWKKSGMLVQGDRTGDPNLTEAVAAYLKIKYNKPGNVFAGLIHRIDRPVSGLVLFARTSKGLSRMNEVFKSRKVKKTYLAIVEGKLSDIDGELKHMLWKDQKKNKSFVSSKDRKGAKEARLKFNTLQILDRYTLVELLPETGRHHQIRAQMASIGHPIKGDLKYGSKRSNQDGSICLHAWKLEFEHPIKKENVLIEAKMPEGDIWSKIQL